MLRCFTEKNSKGENVLLLDNTSEWTVARDTAMYTVGNVRVAGCVITGDAVDRFAELERSAPRWISVKDRLPEAFNSVLVFSRRMNKMFTAFLSNDTRFRGNKVWILCGGGVDCIPGVTHWQPLPAPPAE